MRANRTVILASLTLLSCLSNVVALNPDAKEVKIVRETDKPLTCKVLGKITGTSRDDDGKLARSGAENDFRNHAAELDANFALVETDRDNRVGTSSQRDVFLGGKALYCMTEELEEAAAKKEAGDREAKEKAEAEAKAKEEAEAEQAELAKKGKK
ncbi:MAG TPA: DUF4156 domain-containing protein [Polyangiaceae bacterium]|nr:DUF4156 domain-containing protein [Polyangiaceae bacterium]